MVGTTAGNLAAQRVLTALGVPLTREDDEVTGWADLGLPRGQGPVTAAD
ncbi:hypothetical protein [Nonomuraea sp. NPDC050783]